MLIELTKKEMNVLANALESKIRQLEADAKGDYSPDTKKQIRQMFRKHLKDAKKLRGKIRFVSLDK